MRPSSSRGIATRPLADTPPRVRCPRPQPTRGEPRSVRSSTAVSHPAPRAPFRLCALRSMRHAVRRKQKVSHSHPRSPARARLPAEPKHSVRKTQPSAARLRAPFRPRARLPAALPPLLHAAPCATQCTRPQCTLCSPSPPRPLRSYRPINHCHTRIVPSPALLHTATPQCRFPHASFHVLQLELCGT